MTSSTPRGSDDNLDATEAPAPAETAPAAAATAVPSSSEPVADAQPEPVRIETAEERVVVRRAVRYPRLMIMGAIIGVVLGAIYTLMFPVLPDADYTLGQVLGFTCLITGVLGLALGGLLALILDRTVGRKKAEVTAQRVTTHNAD